MLSITEQVPSVASLYPNPVKDVLFISDLEFTSVEIYDTKSTLVYQGYSQKINVSEFNNGLYWVKINLKDHAYNIKKIIKQ